MDRDEAGKVRHRSRTVRGTRREAARELARRVASQADASAALDDDAAADW